MPAVVLALFVELNEKVVSGLTDLHVLWVDIQGQGEVEVTQVASLLHLHRQSVRNLLNPIGRPRLDNYGEYFQINVVAVKEVDHQYDPMELDLFSGPNYVVTAHSEPIEYLESFERQVQGDTKIGQLNSASFLAALLDWHIASYFKVLNKLEEDVDRLDEAALLKRADREFLGELVELRRRVSELRQLLAPHQEVFASLSRPDFEAIATTESAAHFRSLNDRLDRAIDAVEHAREMVIGTFELFMTGTAQSTNDTMKVLTLVTVIVGVTGVLAGVMGMNFTIGFFESGLTGFLIVVASMVLLAGGLLALARWRDWL